MHCQIKIEKIMRYISMLCITEYITARGINGFTQGWHYKTKQYDNKSGIVWRHNNELAGISVVWDMWMISSIGYFKYDKPHGADFTFHMRRVRIGRGMDGYTYSRDWYDDYTFECIATYNPCFEHIEHITRFHLGHKHGVQFRITDKSIYTKYYQHGKQVCKYTVPPV